MLSTWRRDACGSTTAATLFDNLVAVRAQGKHRAAWREPISVTVCGAAVQRKKPVCG
jgi:hypothetical protein